MALRDHDSSPSLRRVVLTAWVAVGLGASVTGCTSTTALPAEEAVPHYDQFTEDAFASLDSVRPLGWKQEGEASVGADGDTCQFHPGTWVAAEAL
ncbi:MAG: hypothetical protein Q4G40_11750, partial [Brachybacterium sp.]|nr:hypothetical protein [Brachybacterium sp.]